MSDNINFIYFGLHHLFHAALNHTIVTKNDNNFQTSFHLAKNPNPTIGQLLWDPKQPPITSHQHTHTQPPSINQDGSGTPGPFSICHLQQGGSSQAHSKHEAVCDACAPPAAPAGRAAAATKCQVLKQEHASWCVAWRPWQRARNAV